MRDPDGDGIIPSIPKHVIGSELVSIQGSDLIIYATSNKQAGEYNLIITLTDDNVKPLSRNYSMSLTITTNPNLVDETVVIPESSEKRDLQMKLRSMQSNGNVYFTLSEPIFAANYEQLILNLTNSMTVNISA